MFTALIHYSNYPGDLRSLFSRAGRLFHFTLLIGMSVLLFSACDNADRTTNVVTAPEDAVETLPMGEGLDLGALAPDFVLPDNDAKSRSFSEFQGQELVVVFYRTGT